MDWTSLITGALAASLAYAMFADKKKEQPDGAEDYEEDAKGYIAELFCGTCRKMQKHEEVQPLLFECKKCHRQIDLRRGREM